MLFAVTVLVLGIPGIVSAEETQSFPYPFVSDEDPTGQETGIYLPQDTTESELSAALLIRAELGTKTWQEDEIVLGTFAALPKESRKNRILIAAFNELPKEAQKRFPEEEKPISDRPVIYQYEDNGTVLVLTSKSKEHLVSAASSLIRTEESTAEETYVPKAELDLSLWPYPFRIGNSFQPMAIVFSDEILDTELNLLGRVLAMKAEEIPTEIDLKIVRSSQIDTCFGRNLVIIGTENDSEFLTSLLSEEEIRSDRGMIRLTELAQESEDVTTNVSALLLYGKDEETLSYVLRYLRNEENVSRMTGNTLFVDSELNAESLHAEEETETETESEAEEAADPMLQPQGNRGLPLGICLVAIGAVAFGCVLLVINSIRDRRNGG